MATAIHFNFVVVAVVVEQFSSCPVSSCNGNYSLNALRFYTQLLWEIFFSCIAILQHTNSEKNCTKPADSSRHQLHFVPCRHRPSSRSYFAEFVLSLLQSVHVVLTTELSLLPTDSCDVFTRTLQVVYT